MEVRIEGPALERLSTDGKYTAGLDGASVKAFRKRVQFIKAAVDERVFYAMKSLHYEKLQGDREGRRQMRFRPTKAWPEAYSH